MPILLKDLVKYCNSYLSIDEFKDSSLNGLQIEGKDKISKIITGVSACGELFEEAVKQKVDAVIVHHGLFWGKEQAIINILKKRIKILLDNNISLLAYHLPLDANQDIGNNILIAKQLNLKNIERFLEYNGQKISFKGDIDQINFDDFVILIEKILGPIKAKVNITNKVQHIGICSGGASMEVEQAFSENLDTYITGEIGEPTVAYCREAGINYIALGHYNSEIWGVRALGEKLNEKFNIDVKFVKINNPN